jgi:hypothetical protein
MQDYAPQGLPTLNIPNFGLPNFGLGISGGLLSILFTVTLFFTVIYTLMLFNHWRKYAPSPFRAFKYAIIYTIGTAGVLILLLTLLPMFTANS